MDGDSSSDRFYFLDLFYLIFSSSRAILFLKLINLFLLYQDQRRFASGIFQNPPPEIALSLLRYLIRLENAEHHGLVLADRVFVKIQFSLGGYRKEEFNCKKGVVSIVLTMSARSSCNT